MTKELTVKIDFIGFHGQTIFHNSDEKNFKEQLGDGKAFVTTYRKNRCL